MQRKGKEILEVLIAQRLEDEFVHIHHLPPIKAFPSCGHRVRQLMGCNLSKLPQLLTHRIAFIVRRDIDKKEQRSARGGRR